MGKNMGKNFGKTMTFDDFKSIQKETPSGIFDDFVDVAKILEIKMRSYNDAKSKLLKLFHDSPEKIIFTYENLASFGEYKPSEIVLLMTKSKSWDITKVPEKNEITISFTINNETFTTNPISFGLFKSFLNIE
jgi:hypothetical protein